VIDEEPRPPPPARVLDWCFVVGAACIGAALAYLTGVPGGIVFGAAVGSAVVVLGHDRGWHLPDVVRSGVMIAVGTTVGIRMNPETMGVLGTTVGSAVLAALLLVVAGWGIAVGLDRLGILIPGGLMATSPGALEVLTVLAIEDGEGPLEVALFHTVRVVLVMVSVPALLLLLP
jgi:uncharacterized protein